MSQEYAMGWRRAALWANRDDLIADIESPAYERDMVADLATLRQQAARVDDDTLLDVARRVGLRQQFTGVNATDAKFLLRTFVDALSAQQAARVDNVSREGGDNEGQPQGATPGVTPGYSPPSHPTQITGEQPAPERQGEAVAWIKPDWQNPTSFDGMSPVTTYPTKGWLPLYTHTAAPVGVPDGAKDAARYRFIRDEQATIIYKRKGHGEWEPLVDTGESSTRCASLDAAIDAAMLAAAPSAPQGTQQGEGCWAPSWRRCWLYCLAASGASTTAAAVQDG